ncbi:MAG: hypothetical protein CVV52_03735 [Spirochaetae bacterium HGW-Spirochaetae-8]|jgi:integrase|nr:MAG: hypothetical protein CVV52_03735 [Spirochaetae bacterium HGW-Spirochaetae-8]
MKGYKFTCRNGRHIQVRFDGTNKWVSTGCKRIEDAIVWAERSLRHQEEERLESSVTLQEFSKDYFLRTDSRSIRRRNEYKNRYFSDGYYKAMEARLVNYILPEFGCLTLPLIKSLAIDEWYVELKKENGDDLSDDSKNKVLQCLSVIMDDAVRLGLIKENPCDKIEPMSVRSKTREAFSEDEMELMFPKEDDRAALAFGTLMWSCYFQVMKCTGFRPGEVSGLKRSNYYPELGGVYTTSSVNSPSRAVVNRIKTTGKGKPYKVGLLSSQCCRLLDMWLRLMPEGQEYLFMVDGKHIASSTSCKHFKTCAEKLGVSLEGRTQYSLRHTFQTAIAGEVERSTVEELMGHTRFRPGYDHRDGERRLRQLQGLRQTLENIV